MKNRIKPMLYVSLGATLIALCSWITVPFAIPFTMQTFALFLLPRLFGGRIGGLSVVFHVAIGMAGLPVFSGFQNGISALLSPTGGYIIGFALVGGLYFALNSILIKNRIIGVAFPYVCLLLCYCLGTAWCMLYVSSNGSVGIASAISMCVLPYVLPDIIKIALAGVVAERLRGYVKN